MTIIAALLIAYLLGSINLSIVITKLTGKPDPRTQGSGNAGATNMLRTNGKRDAILVLLGDALKGLIAVLIAAHLGVHGSLLGFVALSAMIGHVFPLYFGFRGGKGVATFAGALFGLDLMVALTFIIVWLVVALVTRYSSLASLSAAASTILGALMFHHAGYIPGLLLMVLLIVWKHQSNIQKLKSGTESKISFS